MIFFCKFLSAIVASAFVTSQAWSPGPLGFLQAQHVSIGKVDGNSFGNASASTVAETQDSSTDADAAGSEQEEDSSDISSHDFSGGIEADDKAPHIVVDGVEKEGKEAEDADRLNEQPAFVPTQLSLAKAASSLQKDDVETEGNENEATGAGTDDEISEDASSSADGEEGSSEEMDTSEGDESDGSSLMQKDDDDDAVAEAEADGHMDEVSQLDAELRGADGGILGEDIVNDLDEDDAEVINGSEEEEEMPEDSQDEDTASDA